MGGGGTFFFPPANLLVRIAWIGLVAKNIWLEPKEMKGIKTERVEMHLADSSIVHHLQKNINKSPQHGIVNGSIT